MSDRNLDVVLALAAAAWKAGVPADEIIRVVQTIELEPRVSGEKPTPTQEEIREALGDVVQTSGIGGTDLKPAKPE